MPEHLLRLQTAAAVLLHRGRVMGIDVFLIDFFRSDWFGFHCAVRIYRVAQLFGRLEERNALSRNIDFGSSLRVAPGSGITLPGPKAAEAANLDFVTSLQRADDGIEECIHDHLAIAAGQVSEGCHFINKVGFSHSGFLSYWGRAIGALVKQSVVVDCRRDGG